MNILLTIFKKDTRRFWPLLLAWFAQLALSSTSMVWRPDWQIPAFQLIDMLSWFVFGLVVVAYFHEDRFAGGHEFLMTRPVPPLYLLAAKLSSLFAWLVLPSGIALALVAQYLGSESSFALKVGLSAMSLSLTVMFAVSLIASVTTSMIQCTIAIVAVVALLDIDGFYWFFEWTALYIYAPLRWYNETDYNYAIAATLVVFSAGGLIYQVIARKSRRTIVYTVLSFMIVWDVAAVLPSLARLGGNTSQRTPASQIQIGELNPKLTQMVDSSSVERRILALDFNFKNVPPDRLFSISATRSEFENASQHFRWRQGENSSDQYRRQSDGTFREVECVSLTVLNPDYPPLPSKSRGRFQSHWMVNEFEVREVEKTFRVGETVYGRGIVLHVNHVTDPHFGDLPPYVECEFLAVDWWKRRFRVYLINHSVNKRTFPVEVFRPPATFASIAQHKRVRINLSGWPPERSDSKGKVERDVFPVEWLENASIVLVEENWLGAVEKTVTIDDFEIP